jgi:hypothetical protein
VLCRQSLAAGAEAVADVVLLWQLTIADLDKAYLDDMAAESLAAVLAELEIDRAYAVGLTAADEALLNAEDLARVDRWLAEVDADSAQQTQGVLVLANRASGGAREVRGDGGRRDVTVGGACSR